MPKFYSRVLPSRPSFFASVTNMFLNTRIYSVRTVYSVHPPSVLLVACFCTRFARPWTYVFLSKRRKRKRKTQVRSPFRVSDVMRIGFVSFFSLYKKTFSRLSPSTDEICTLVSLQTYYNTYTKFTYVYSPRLRSIDPYLDVRSVDKNRSSSGASARIVKPSFENQCWVIKNGLNSSEDTGRRFAEIRTQTFRLEDRVTCYNYREFELRWWPWNLDPWVLDERWASSIERALRGENQSFLCRFRFPWSSSRC